MREVKEEREKASQEVLEERARLMKLRAEENAMIERRFQSSRSKVAERMVEQGKARLLKEILDVWNAEAAVAAEAKQAEKERALREQRRVEEKAAEERAR